MHIKKSWMDKWTKGVIQQMFCGDKKLIERWTMITKMYQFTKPFQKINIIVFFSIFDRLTDQVICILDSLCKRYSPQKISETDRQTKLVIQQLRYKKTLTYTRKQFQVKLKLYSSPKTTFGYTYAAKQGSEGIRQWPIN